MIGGGGVFLAGLGMILVPLVRIFLGDSMINISCFVPFFLIGGVVAFLKGF